MSRAAEVDAVLEASFVLANQGLLVDQDSRAKFIAGCGTEVMTQPGVSVQIIGSAQPVQEAANLVLAQDRITLECGSNRFVGKREFPLKDDLERLADVLAVAFQHSPHVRGRGMFGVNLILTYAHGSGLTSSEYLAGRLLQESVVHQIAKLAPDTDVSGQSISLSYSDGPRRWIPKFEPRSPDRDPFGERVYLSINCHHEDAVIPLGKAPIWELLQTVWAHTHELVGAVNAPE